MPLKLNINRLTEKQIEISKVGIRNLTVNHKLSMYIDDYKIVAFVFFLLFLFRMEDIGKRKYT